MHHLPYRALTADILKGSHWRARALDRAESNLRGTTAAIIADWDSPLLRTPRCATRCINSGAANALTPVDSVVSGCIAVSLAQKPVGASGHLFHQLCLVAYHSTTIVDGPPPGPDDPISEHRDAFLKLCCANQGDAGAATSLELQMLLTSDLTKDFL